jgi:hypothetical protein
MGMCNGEISYQKPKTKKQSRKALALVQHGAQFRSANRGQYYYLRTCELQVFFYAERRCADEKKEISAYKIHEQGFSL